MAGKLLDTKMKRIGVAVVAGIAVLVGAAGAAGMAGALDGAPAPLAGKVTLSQGSSGLMAAMSLEDLAREADLVVTGTVSGTSKAFAVRPIDGSDPSIFHDVYLTVNDVIAGDPRYADAGKKTVALRTEGGELDRVKMVMTEAPAYEEGGEYLLFLTRQLGGADYNTEGDHYYVIGGGQGVWSGSNGSFSNAFVGDQQGGTTLSSADAAREVQAVRAKLSADEVGSGSDSVEDRIAHLERDFQAGRLSQEGRDYGVQQIKKDASSYSQVMSEDEQAAWEQEVVERNGGEDVAMGVSS